eukprot:264020-Amphidinium_carterae.1
MPFGACESLEKSQSATQQHFFCVYGNTSLPAQGTELAPAGAHLVENILHDKLMECWCNGDTSQTT